MYEEEPEEERRRRKRFVAWLFGTWGGRSLASIVSLAITLALGLTVTGAVLADQVTMATVTTSGGTLDILANGDIDDTAVVWGGAGATISASVNNMSPGDTLWGDVTIDNTGTLPLTMTVTQTGSDTHPSDATAHCFSYYFRQIAAPTGATKDAAFPVNLTGMGSDATTDAGTALFETGVSGRVLDDVVGVDSTWETDDSKTYRLHVRMRNGCTEASVPATGTLDFQFNAVQA